MLTALRLWWRHEVMWRLWSIYVVNLGGDPGKTPTWWLRTVVQEYDEWMEACDRLMPDPMDRAEFRGLLHRCTTEFRRRTGFYVWGR